MLKSSSTGQIATFLCEHEPVLRRMACRLCKNHHDANDLVQDTLERALSHFHRIDLDRSGHSWVLAIMHNLFIDRCRRAARAGVFVEIDHDSMMPPPDEPEPAWRRVDPEHLPAAVQRLDAPFRTVLEMYTVEGQSYQEISTALGIPRSTVGTRMSRARSRLKALLSAIVARQAHHVGGDK